MDTCPACMGMGDPIALIWLSEQLYRFQHFCMVKNKIFVLISFAVMSSVVLCVSMSLLSAQALCLSFAMPRFFLACGCWVLVPLLQRMFGYLGFFLVHLLSEASLDESFGKK